MSGRSQTELGRPSGIAEEYVLTVKSEREELTVHRLKVKKRIVPYNQLKCLQEQQLHYVMNLCNKSLEVAQQRRGGDGVPECSLEQSSTSHVLGSQYANLLEKSLD